MNEEGHIKRQKRVAENDEQYSISSLAASSSAAPAQQCFNSAVIVEAISLFVPIASLNAFYRTNAHTRSVASSAQSRKRSLLHRWPVLKAHQEHIADADVLFYAKCEERLLLDVGRFRRAVDRYAQSENCEELLALASEVDGYDNDIMGWRWWKHLVGPDIAHHYWWNLMATSIVREKTKVKEDRDDYRNTSYFSYDVVFSCLAVNGALVYFQFGAEWRSNPHAGRDFEENPYVGITVGDDGAELDLQDDGDSWTENSEFFDQALQLCGLPAGDEQHLRKFFLMFLIPAQAQEMLCIY